MNYYLVDYENIGIEGIKTLRDIKDKNVIIIFYSENSSQTLPLDIFNEQTTCYAIKANVGTKNALDFQLSSYLGYLIATNFDSDEYTIVSNDTGYDCLCDYWKNYSIKVKRLPVTHEQVSYTVTLNELVSAIGKYNSYSDCLLKIINKHNSMHDICNDIQRLLRDSKKAGEIYKKIKPLLTEKGKV